MLATGVPCPSDLERHLPHVRGGWGASAEGPGPDGDLNLSER